MSIVSHMGGLFVPPTRTPTDHPLAACTLPLTTTALSRLMARSSSGEQASVFQGGRFMLEQTRGRSASLARKRGVQMDFPSFSESLSQTLAAWGLPTTLLDAVNPVVQSMLWGGLLRALEVSAMPRQGQGVPPVSQPAGVGSAATRCAPLPFTRQPLAQPRSQQQEQSGWLDLSDYLVGWHQNVRLALWVAAEALEALRAAPDAEEYRLLFSEQCRCIGQWYGELEQWAGASLASIILQGELRFLRHRTSAVATALLFAA